MKSAATILFLLLCLTSFSQTTKKGKSKYTSAQAPAPLPTLGINNVTVSEGAGAALFTVRLSALSAQAVSVNYATAAGTAGTSDYTPVSGTLTFSPSEATKTISVPITEDAIAEGNENFFLNLSSAVNASIFVSQGTATITDNDNTGTHYYVAPTGGTGTGTDSTQPWSYSYFLSRTLPNDAIVHFKRGGTYQGQFTLKSASGVTYRGDDFGTGAKAVISAMTPLNTWTNEGGGVYSAAISATTIKTVLLNGEVQRMGRWPNVGTFNFMDSRSTNVSLTDAPLVGAQSWIGAEAVIRTNRSRFYRSTITAHNQSTGQITFNALPENISHNNGYFIQNHRATLDQLGEWYYSSGRLYVYFGGASPSSYTVRVNSSNINYAVWGQVISTVTLSGFTFEGGNINAVRVNSSTNITIENCEAYYGGQVGIKIDNSSGILITGATVRNANDFGIDISGGCSNATLTNSTISRNGVVHGLISIPAGWGTAVWASGNGMNVTNNRIDSCGFNGINFRGNDVLIKKNYVTNYCLVTDDGGGVYTFHGSTDRAINRRTNRLIDSNVVVCNLSKTAGLSWHDGSSTVENLYADENTNGITFRGNVSAYGSAGIYLHETYNITITGNQLYENSSGLKIRDNFGATLSDGLSIQANHMLSKTTTHRILEMNYPSIDLLKGWGVMNSNFYSRPTADNTFVFDRENNGTAFYITLSDWRTLSGYDLATSPTPSGLSTASSDFVFEFNASDSPVTRTAPWYFKDLNGTMYAPSFTVPAWSAVMGVKMTVQP